MIRSTAAIAMTMGALALGATAAQAEPLWRDIEAGMTVEAVRALYPLKPGEGRKVEHHKSVTELHGFMVLGKCKPRVEILHPEGAVTGISIWMRDEGAFKPTCNDEARLALFQKFGPPDMDNTRRSILPLYADMASESLTWIEPAMTVEWREGNGLAAWSITYRAAPTNSAGQL